jgi:tetratricopeptide (TPR) repeat protein
MKQIIILLSIFIYCLPVFAKDNPSLSGDKDYQIRKKFDYFFLEAIRLKQNDKHNDAFYALQHALKIDSTSSAALYEISNYYVFFNADSLVIDALEKAVKYSPDNFEYKASLANTYRELGNFDEAIRLYEELAAANPDKADLHFYLSDLYLRKNQIDKAIKSLDALEDNVGMNEALSLQKYKLYMNVEQKEDALKEIERLAAKFPMEAKYQIIIGDFYLEKNELEKALLYYEKAHKTDPQSPYYIVAMVNYYEKTGNKEAATQEVESVLKNSELDIDTKLNILGRYIGNLISKDKNADSATALFESLMEQHSQEMELNLMYAQFLLSQNKLEEAKFQFKVVTEANPENIVAWRNLLGIAIKEDNPDEIISFCDAALIHFSDAAEFYFYKGMGLFQKKDYQAALTVFQDGITYIPPENRPMISTFYGNIGDLHHQLGQKEEAYQAYDQSLEYNEDNVFVLNNYAYFLSLDKVRLDQAERMSSKCVKSQPKNATYIDTYAWVLFQRENYSLAKFYIESAIMGDGEKSSDILEHYGDILFKTGNQEKAVQQWEKALKLKEETGEKDTTVLQKKIENKTYYATEK